MKHLLIFNCCLLIVAVSFTQNIGINNLTITAKLTVKDADATTDAQASTLNSAFDNFTIGAAVFSVKPSVESENQQTAARYSSSVRNSTVAFDDRDNDGLDDAFEIAQGWSNRHQDIVLVAVIRPNMSRFSVQGNLTKVVDFFARIPSRNVDGTTGIIVHWVWGNRLPAEDSDAPGKTPREYPLVRTAGMPRIWIGKAHGFLISTASNLGGQTSQSDWSGVSNNWQTIVHELGHQLGLDHIPLDSKVHSPIYASLMNYDYDYSFNGSDSIQFSTGKFSSLLLNETNLIETLPFSRKDLEFLSKGPYFFNIKEVNPASTTVDFNRNSIFGESGVRADINSGYAVTAYDRRLTEPSAGGFHLTVFENRLINIFSVRDDISDWSTYVEAGLTRIKPGGLKYQFFVAGQAQPSRNLVSDGVTGDPFAIEAFSQLFVAFPTASGYTLRAYENRPGTDVLVIKAFVEVNTPDSYPILVKTTSPDELYLFIWNSVTRQITYRKVMQPNTSPIIELSPAQKLKLGLEPSSQTMTSNSLTGAVWNPKTSQIEFVHTETSEGFQGRIKLQRLARMTNGWFAAYPEWAAGVNGEIQRTLSRPTVIFDNNPSAGTNGLLSIFVLWERNGTDAVPSSVIRRSGPYPNSVWESNMMINEWTKSRSAPSATMFGREIVWGWRANEKFKEFPNRMEILLRASGIADFGITDFDDVRFISEQGLRLSLLAVGGR